MKSIDEMAEIYDEYIKQRKETCAHCGSPDIWPVHANYNNIDQPPEYKDYCAKCHEPWQGELESFEEWAEKNGIEL